MRLNIKILYASLICGTQGLNAFYASQHVGFALALRSDLSKTILLDGLQCTLFRHCITNPNTKQNTDEITSAILITLAIAVTATILV